MWLVMIADLLWTGCLYKHEMPTDPVMLEKLGLRDIPRWYREKYGIPSILNNGNNNPRPQIAPGQQWRDYAQHHVLNPTLPSPVRPIQYPTRLGITAAVDGSSGHDEHSKQKSLNQSSFQQHPGVVQGQTPSTRDTTDSTETDHTQKHGTKNIPGQGKKIDLLSFDPLPGYPSLDPVRSSPSKLTLSASGNKDASEELDLAQHQEFMRNMQSLMSESGASNGNIHPVPLSSPQARTKKPQKSRRLYQPRTPSEVPAKNQATVETPSKYKRNNSTKVMSSFSPNTKSSPQSASSTAVPGNNVSSASSSRVASPSNGSPSSSSDSVTLPASRSRAIADRKNVDETKQINPSKDSSMKNKENTSAINSLEVDLFGLGLGNDE